MVQSWGHELLAGGESVGEPRTMCVCMFFPLTDLRDVWPPQLLWNMVVQESRNDDYDVTSRTGV
jgi:hypothetical protein